jgi:hypothetical protein
MSEERHVGDGPPEAPKAGGGNGHGAKPTLGDKVEVEGAGEAEVPKKLTAEEQMALYEEKLKEEDWGHQPC